MAGNLKKIELETTPQTPSMNKKKRFPWVVLAIPLVILAIVLLLGGILALSFKGIAGKAQLVMIDGKELGAAVKKQDLVKAKETLGKTRKSLAALNLEYNKVKPFEVIPLVGAYIRDGEHAIKAGFAGLDAGDKAVSALEPNADLLGLKGKSTFVSGSADDRIQTAVKTMTALTPKINGIALDIDTLRKELGQIDPGRYPERIGNTVIRSRLVLAKDVIENAANLFVNAQPLLTNLPAMLGEPSEKRYLVIFQNDKELRSTGGFMTAYAQFRFVRGKAILEKADDIYALDAAKSKKFSAPPEILKFHKGVYELNIRDSNYFSDFKISMQKFEELYNTTSGHEKIDGILAVDTHVLVEALKILGPMYVYGREFSADTDKRCDCPKAVYELEDYSSRPVGYVRDARKDIIGVLLHSILVKALGVSPSQYWGKLFQMLITEISDKHVLAYLHDTSAQKAAESFNMAGRIMTASESAAVLKYREGNGWDYLHINESNMGGAKANMFVTEKVTKDVTINSDGTVKTSLTVDYKNSYPGSDCGLETGGLCLNAPLRNWVRVYVPAGSKLVSSKGTQAPKDNQPQPMTTYDSLNKTVFEGFLIVNPLGVARLELTYTSPVKSTDGKYRLLVQKQPGTGDYEYTFKITGKEVKKVKLQTDTELVL
ncbi:hypothetical protein A2Z00_02250 [Candidatus Gottesmanbacteria bacterium RBG_13_45_10]|uniref:DUF4012 domain-containing protein n=1 Tax=Candidatus Gottesmanbacteria bacterium RBG_13_45_10 TaxID=1798370 RepID=A0A1F5ZG54_9BACT|nr:MAG: hypothetical protein A2Z00_02250 [Candidatus Gottesmanbacteria bacterium RBG_13_45_10]